MKYKILFTLILFFGLSAFAHADNRIVAVIDEGVITERDLEDRFKFIVKSNKIDLSGQNVDQFKSHILSLLINEMLLAQEAEKLKLKATQEEIQGAIVRIEETRGIAKGSMFNNMDDEDKKQTLAQIISAVTWEKFLFTVIAPRTEVTEYEVREFISINHTDKPKLAKAEIDSIRSNLKFKKIESQGHYYMDNVRKKKFIEVHGFKLTSQPQ